MRSAYSGTVGHLSGGRVALLLLLYAFALYQFYSAGFSAFSIVCMAPILVLGVIVTFRYKMFLFWTLCAINFFVQWKDFPSTGLPMSLYNEALEMMLLALAIINVKEMQFERFSNIMFVALLIWCSFCTLEVLNDSCNLGIQVGAWYGGARMMAFQLMYCFLVFSIYINNPHTLVKYLIIWGGLVLFAALWVWKQENIGLTNAENQFIQGRGRSTHIINAGTTIRYFSVYSDAANFGIGMAANAVAFLIFGITSSIKKHKFFFFFVAIASFWATFPSGTRTSIFCLLAGLATYVFLSKSFKIAIPVSIIFILFYFFLAFTTIGNGNAQIRRMRSGFNKDDASMGAREANQKVMKKYLADAPWGLGVGLGYDNVPANNKYRKLATIPPDSEYVYIWIHTGPIGITVFIITTAIMFLGACWVVFFRIENKSLRGIGAGLCCAFVSIQLGGYANQVLMQFPNCLIFYGGLSIVYTLPLYEKQWNEYELNLITLQKEKKRLRLEKIEQKRVKPWYSWIYKYL